MLVTGGAGFIGSHIVDVFMTRGANVTVFDDLSTGTMRNVTKWRKNPKFAFMRGNLLNQTSLKKVNFNEYELVCHLAANSEVRSGAANSRIHFIQNVVATHNLLEHLKKATNPPTLMFTSTSTIYGEAQKIPTPEDYGPLEPISTYGASKLAGEALIGAYAHTYNLNAITYRLANIVGSRSQHGVVYDFIQKLKKNPNYLEILGDGTQTKSYLYIRDLIESMLFGLKRTKKQVEIYNIGSEDQVSVTTIAQIVIEEMHLENVILIYTGGVDGGRGWKGDVKEMLLDISKIKSLGWKPKLNSKEAVQQAARNLVAESG